MAILSVLLILRVSLTERWIMKVLKRGKGWIPAKELSGDVTKWSIRVLCKYCKHDELAGENEACGAKLKIFYGDLHLRQWRGEFGSCHPYAAFQCPCGKFTAVGVPEFVGRQLCSEKVATDDGFIDGGSKYRWVVAVL